MRRTLIYFELTAEIVYIVHFDFSDTIKVRILYSATLASWAVLANGPTWTLLGIILRIWDW